MFRPSETEILDLVQRHPLPDGVDDMILNRAELADHFGTSENTINSRMRGGMPCETEGSNGRAYEFRLSVCWAWYQGYIEHQRGMDLRKTKNRNQMRLALLGGDAPDGAEFLSPKEQKEEYEAAVAYMKAASLRGELIYVAEVEMLLQALLGMTRGFILNLPDEVERIAGLNPEHTATLVERANDFLRGFRLKIEESNFIKQAMAQKASK
jgi:phage terminase Nu1 subunit (DNA packaging protein)